jgi:pimeloyl-ACP methyl ester carboxylesterase
MSPQTPIVMLHGAFCGGWAFEKFREPFERRFARVHAPTLRHHGAGEGDLRALGRTSVAHYADDLADLVRSLGAPPVIVGHSLGGLLAQMLAARMPVRALILLAPCAPWGVMPTTFFEIASSQAMLLAGDFWNTALQPNYWVAASNALDNLDPDEKKKVFERFVPESGLATFEIMQWAFDFARATHVDARQVTCPILCMVGSDDKINPPSTVESIARRYRGRAVYEVIDGQSHWLIGEPGWERIAARSLDWLEQVLAEDAQPATA